MNANEFSAALEECRIADEDLFLINRKELNAMISKSKLEQIELNRCGFDKPNVKKEELHAKKEDDNMYTSLEITFKSGETITYKDGEWDDYSYDRKAIIVKKKGVWVGIYNFDNVFCVELKKK